jgi:hypothetical protein
MNLELGKKYNEAVKQCQEEKQEHIFQMRETQLES